MAWMRRNFFTADLFLLGYLVIIIVMALASMPGKYTLELVAFHGGVAAFYIVMQRFGVREARDVLAGKNPPRWMRVLAVTYVLSPVALIPLSFLQLGKLIEDAKLVRAPSEHTAFVDREGHYDPDHANDNGLRLGRFGGATYFDHVLKETDEAIFGVYPPKWVRQYHTPWLTGLMQLGYTFYYLAPLLVVVPLIIQRRWRDLRLGVAIIVGCILLTYLLYLVVPATGPRFEGGIAYWLPEQPGWFWAEEIYRSIDKAETFRWNAFPSGHVAVSLCCLLVALRFNRKLGYAMILPVLLLCAATIYMGYHYGVDVLGGIACAVIVAVLVPPLVGWWEAPFWNDVLRRANQSREYS